jgi:hypothetical protein
VRVEPRGLTFGSSLWFSFLLALLATVVAVGRLSGWRAADACLRGRLLCYMALSLSEVYHLTGETLRRECGERGLDHSGPVRSLRQRKPDHIRSGPLDTSAKAEVTQASGLNDLVINEGITDSPGVASVSRRSSGDGPIPVLVELLRPISHLTLEEP